MMEEGLKLDPLNVALKLQLDATTNSILKDLLEGMQHCLLKVLMLPGLA